MERTCVYIAMEVERRRELLRGPAGTWAGRVRSSSRRPEARRQVGEHKKWAGSDRRGGAYGLITCL